MTGFGRRLVLAGVVAVALATALPALAAAPSLRKHAAEESAANLRRLA